MGQDEPLNTGPQDRTTSRTAGAHHPISDLISSHAPGLPTLTTDTTASQHRTHTLNNGDFVSSRDQISSVGLQTCDPRPNDVAGLALAYPVGFSKLDVLAGVVASTMMLGPLLAAYCGRL